jgi:hypothetical protein
VAGNNGLSTSFGINSSGARIAPGSSCGTGNNIQVKSNGYANPLKHHQLMQLSSQPVLPLLPTGGSPTATTGAANPINKADLQSGQTTLKKTNAQDRIKSKRVFIENTAQSIIFTSGITGKPGAIQERHEVPPGQSSIDTHRPRVTDEQHANFLNNTNHQNGTSSPSGMKRKDSGGEIKATKKDGENQNTNNILNR